jgi:hypothetical protein
LAWDNAGARWLRSGDQEEHPRSSTLRAAAWGGNPYRMHNTR